MLPPQPAIASNNLGATCFLRLMTPGSVTVPSSTYSPNARSTAPCSPAVSSSVALARMSVTISAESA